ncbi:MAG: ABC transporter ATP-binding protein [Alphaproteobacteria bacterium]|nr:ABC transporter ATP-binding protein [Alphaproteobacteria bacterium]
MIHVEKLYVEYPSKRALNNVSFDIPSGSITALVGPNGAGKTTLMRCIAALDEPFSGQITVNGVNVVEHPRRAHQMLGYLSDFFGVYHDLTVYQNLMFIARIHQLPQNTIEKQVLWAAQCVGLTSYLHSSSRVLSRGWRQRLGIAMSLVHRPQLVLLDEPASGLDPEARTELSHLFKTLNNEGMTLLVSSHILAELEDYCTDMLVLRDGEVVEHRLSQPANKDTSLIMLTLPEDAVAFEDKIKNMPEVLGVKTQGREIYIELNMTEAQHHEFLKRLIEQDIPVMSFQLQKQKLQDIYLSLTQKGNPL